MSIMSRRAFVRQAGPLALAAPAVAAASSRGIAPGPIATSPDPGLYEAARAFKDALDASLALDIERDRRWGAVRAGKLDRAEYDAWSEANDRDDATDAVEACQDRLYRALDARGLNAVILDGTMILGPWDRRYMPLSNWPDQFCLAEMSRVLDLDAIGGPAR